MKNLIGLYPGTAYCSVRSCVHDQAAAAGSPGVAFEIVDMVRANKLGLTVVAGANPLATDMVAADNMGFKPRQIPTFSVAHTAGMSPASLDEIEVRGISRGEARLQFAKPNMTPWKKIRDVWGCQRAAPARSGLLGQ